jgi:hypothetical protein
MKRLRKLQERERDQLRNQQLVQEFKRKKNRELELQIQEEKEQFDMEH